MRPLDPRLLKYAKATSSFLAFSAVNGLVNAALIISQALLLGGLLADVFIDGKELAEVRVAIYLLLAVVLARSVSTWLSDVLATNASNRAKSQLRTAVFEKTLRLGPIWVSGRQSSDLATLSTQGLNALDTYFARYLPQLFLAAAIPLTVVITVLTQDMLSAVIIGLTVPLVPFFMALVGKFTQVKVDRQWQSLQTLSGHFLDLVQGLPTLKVFNRAQRQANAIEQVGNEYRSATMGVLRVSFISSLVLELISTLSVALVAVSIGLRLVSGSMQLREALIVLFLVPEAYAPLRQLGAQFHAVIDGMGAAERMFEILETDEFQSTGRLRPDFGDKISISIDGLEFLYPNSSHLSLVTSSMQFNSGQLAVIKGTSGSGKSTLINLLMGFAVPKSGEIKVNENRLIDLDLEYWRSLISYFPQSPWLPYGSVRSALLMGKPESTDKDLSKVLEKVGIEIGNSDEFPIGLDTLISATSGLSVGQRRRIALARAILQDRPIFMLDEPTASLDSMTEEVVLNTLRELTAQNKCVIAVAHRPHLVFSADQIIELVEPEFAAMNS